MEILWEHFGNALGNSIECFGNCVGRFWKPYGNKGLYIMYFTLIVLSKFYYYVVWVRLQYNELMVLTLLISQCFHFSIQD